MAIEVLVSALITIAVLSYMLGDNPAFRLAMHILVGVGATYVLAIAYEQVLRPSLIDPIIDPNSNLKVFALFGWLGCIFLLSKLLKRAAGLGDVAVGYMIGVGTALALAGALVGTLGPQTLDAVAPLTQGGAIIPNVLVLISTLVVLLSFRYRRVAARSMAGYMTRLGHAFLYVAFGATFALVFIANASVLVSVVQSIADTLSALIFPG